MKLNIWSRAFVRDTAERMLATAAQAVLVVWSLDGVDQIADVEVDLSTFLSAAGFGGLYALLKALVAGQVGDPESASLDPRVGTFLVDK